MFAAGTDGTFNSPVSTSPVSQVQGKSGGFNDAYARGTVNVEIDRKYWNGVMVSPEDNVEIQGKIDKERNNICVDVKQISKICQNLHYKIKLLIPLPGVHILFKLSCHLFY